jgi:hypothetical protein
LKTAGHHILKGGNENVILTEGKGSRNGGVCVDHCFDRNRNHYRSHHPWNPNFTGLQPDFICTQIISIEDHAPKKGCLEIETAFFNEIAR